MLRSLSFVTMRQHQRETRQASPLGFAGTDELINHHLGAVGKVAKLAFPNHQFIGLRCRVTIVKGHDGFFRQYRVNDNEGRLLGVDVLQWLIDASVPFLPILIVQNGMAVKEGAATDVFAGHAHAEALHDQGGVGHVLAHAPVKRQLTLAHQATVINDFLHP